MGIHNAVAGPKRWYVRCLGPGQPEHFFWSRDKCKNRRCPKCEKAVAMLVISENYENPVRLLLDDGL